MGFTPYISDFPAEEALFLEQEVLGTIGIGGIPKDVPKSIHAATNLADYALGKAVPDASGILAPLPMGTVRAHLATARVGGILSGVDWGKLALTILQDVLPILLTTWAGSAPSKPSGA